MAVAAILGYLVGSIPVALLIGRFVGVDPRERGDGNPGWWNMRGLVGDRIASLVLIGDIAKGATAAWAGSMIWGPWWTSYVALLFAMLGHAFPLIARVTGGRGVVTWYGGMLVVVPAVALISLLVGLLATVVSRRLVYGCRAAVFAVPLFQMLIDPGVKVVLTIALMAFIAVRFVVVPHQRSRSTAQLGSSSGEENPGQVATASGGALLNE